MRKRINLISAQKKYVLIERSLGRLKLVVLGVFLILFVLNIAAYLITLDDNKNVSLLSEEKKKLLEYILQQKEVEAKFIYFYSKERQLSGILKDDVSFYPYYKLLTDSLAEATTEASLGSVVIKKDRSAEFTITVESYDALLSFFKNMESDTFLSNFETLVMERFDRDAKTKETYNMSLKGKFKELKP